MLRIMARAPMLSFRGQAGCDEFGGVLIKFPFLRRSHGANASMCGSNAVQHLGF